MIRHVTILAEDNVVSGGGFAWFETVSDTFMSFSQNQVWHNWAAFAQDWRDHQGPKPKLDRFEGLMPTQTQ